MSRRVVLLAVAAVAVVVVLVVGLSQTGTKNSAPEPATVDAAAAREALAGSPPALAALHAQAGRLLDGDRAAVRARLRELRGHPVVVNKWASWCGPCRFEFPIFQRVGVKLGRRVAFVGLNSGDNRGDAASFLRKFPLSYPSYVDPNEKVAVALGAGAAYPTTIFYDAQGRRRFVHQGGYTTDAKLEEDIRRYTSGAAG